MSRAIGERKSVIKQPGCLRYLRDHRGVSVIALIIIMMVLGSLGYVFSALIATKQYSMGMAVPSQQAFYIANSGIEYGIRYASERGWTGVALNGLNGDEGKRELGDGNFTLDYNGTANTLSSIGQVSASQREVVLENFTSFVSNIPCLELVTSIDPPPISGIPACTYEQGHGHGHGHGSTNTYVRFYIRNKCSSQPPLTRFRATWDPASGVLQEVWFDGASKFHGGYNSGASSKLFDEEGNVDTCHGARYEGVEVLVKFNNVDDNATFVFEFEDTNSIEYTFPLGNPLPDC